MLVRDIGPDIFVAVYLTKLRNPGPMGLDSLLNIRLNVDAKIQ